MQSGDDLPEPLNNLLGGIASRVFYDIMHSLMDFVPSKAYYGGLYDNIEPKGVVLPNENGDTRHGEYLGEYTLFPLHLWLSLFRLETIHKIPIGDLNIENLEGFVSDFNPQN